MEIFDPPTSAKERIPLSSSDGKGQKKLSSFFQQIKPSDDSSGMGSTCQSSEKLISQKIARIEGIYYDFENMEKFFAGEGRTITIETDKFFLVACYVPNSGL